MGMGIQIYSNKGGWPNKGQNKENFDKILKSSSHEPLARMH